MSRPARTRRPAPARPIEGPVDAICINRLVPMFAGSDRVELPDGGFERVRDTRREGSMPLQPIGVRLREDVRSWLVEHEIVYGVHCDLNPDDGWVSVDAYLVVPNDDQRVLFVVRWGKP